MRTSCLRFLFLCLVVFESANVSLFGTVVSWKGIGPDGVLPGSLAEHPGDPNILFISSLQSGVYRSTDGGQTWQNCTRGLPVGHRYYFYGKLTIGPVSPYPVYVTVIDALSYSTTPAVWRSTDLGKSWEAFASGEVIPDPSDRERVYAVRRSGVHQFERGSSLSVTTDGGEHWEFWYYESDASYLILCPHPTRPGLVFMVKHKYSGTDWFMRSSNGGRNWTTVRSFPTTVATIVCDKRNPDLVFLGSSGGLYISENAGWIWKLATKQPGDGHVSQIDVRPDGILLVRAGGLFKSSDRGASWSPLPPLPDGVRQVLASSHESRVIFGTTEEGVLRTDNEGAEWRSIDRGISNYDIVQIAVDRVKPGRITVLATSTDRFRSRVLTSTDYGKSWTNIGSPDQDLYFSLLRVDSTDPNCVYLCTSNAFWRSTDGGKSWTDLSAGTAGMFLFDLFVDPQTSGLLITSDLGIFKSTDRGASWVQWSDLSLGLLTPVNGSTMLGGSSKGLYKSIDAGKSWEKILDAVVGALAVDPEASETVYVTNLDSTAPIFRTTDGGQTWHRISLGIGDGANSLAVSHNMVVVGSEWSGVSVSWDAGATWHRANEGLDLPIVSALVVDPQNSASVYLGTAGNGLFSMVSELGNRFIFPVLAEDDRTSTGIAVSNPLDQSVDLEATAHAPDGSVLLGSSNPSDRELGSFQQLALTGSQLFGLGSALPTGGGWFEMETTADVAPVFVLVGTDQTDGSVPATDTSGVLYFSRVYQGSGAFRGHDAITTLTIVNPNDRAIPFRAFLLGSSHKILAGPFSHRIEAQGRFCGDVGTMFGITSVIQNAFVDVLVEANGAPSGVTGFEWIEFPNAKTSVALPAHTTVIGESGYSAQLSTLPGAMTNLKLVNVTDSARTATLEATGDDGKALAPAVVLNIPPWNSVEKDVTELFGFGPGSFVGSLTVSTDAAGLVGDVLFGDFERLERASALALDSNPSTRVVFSQVANGMGYYTGLAILNPGQETAHVKVQVFSAAGQKTGETTVTLSPGGRISRLLTEILPATAGQVRGYVILESDQLIIAQELFATDKILAAVPASVGP